MKATYWGIDPRISSQYRTYEGSEAMFFGNDTASRIVTMDQGSVITTYTFDNNGNLSQETRSAGTIGCIDRCYGNLYLISSCWQDYVIKKACKLLGRQIMWVFRSICLGPAIFFLYGCNTTPARQDLLADLQHKDYRAARSAVAAGADVNASGNALITTLDGRKRLFVEATPLFVVATQGNSEMTRYLLRRGAIPDKAVDDGNTPLMAASGRGFADVASILLSAGAKVDKKTLHGDTALTISVMSGNTESVQMLLRNGADPYLRGGLTSPLQLSLIAPVRDHPRPTTEIERKTLFAGTWEENVLALLKAGANPNAPDQIRSPLMTAIANAPKSIIELLLRYGAKLHGGSPDDSPEVLMARQAGRPSIADFLVTMWPTKSVR
jgi:hypothetical protein